MEGCRRLCRSSCLSAEGCSYDKSGGMLVPFSPRAEDDAQRTKRPNDDFETTFGEVLFAIVK